MNANINEYKKVQAIAKSVLQDIKPFIAAERSEKVTLKRETPPRWMRTRFLLLSRIFGRWAAAGALSWKTFIILKTASPVSCEKGRPLLGLATVLGAKKTAGVPAVFCQ